METSPTMHTTERSRATRVALASGALVRLAAVTSVPSAPRPAVRRATSRSSSDSSVVAKNPASRASSTRRSSRSRPSATQPVADSNSRVSWPKAQADDGDHVAEPDFAEANAVQGDRGHRGVGGVLGGDALGHPGAQVSRDGDHLGVRRVADARAGHELAGSRGRVLACLEHHAREAVPRALGSPNRPRTLA